MRTSVVSTGDGSHEKNGEPGEYLVLHFNMKEGSQEWNINQDEKCDPGE